MEGREEGKVDEEEERRDEKGDGGEREYERGMWRLLGEETKAQRKKTKLYNVHDTLKYV